MLLQMSQNYIPNQFQIHKTNIWSILRSQIPYSIVKIGPFSPIFRKLAQASHTSPFGSRIYFQGFSHPKNNNKPFLDRFECFLKNSIFDRFFGLRSPDPPYFQVHFLKCLGWISKNGFYRPVHEGLNYIIKVKSLPHSLVFQPRKSCGLRVDFR